MYNQPKLGDTLKAGCPIGARLVAAGAGDNTEVSSVGFDRNPAGSAQKFDSAVAVVTAHVNLTATKKLDVNATIQHSGLLASGYVDAPSWAQPAGGADTPALTVTGTGDQYGVATWGFQTKSLNRFVRLQIRPDLDAAGTDVAEVTGCVMFGSPVIMPPA